MENNTFTKSIAIRGIEDKDKWIQLEDTEGIKYTFFKFKQDGSETAAFKGYTAIGLKPGSQVDIFYSKRSYMDKRGVARTGYNILSFTENSLTLKQNAQTDSIKQGQDDYGRRLALHGLVNAYLTTHKIEEAIKALPDLLKLEDSINLVLEGKSLPGRSSEDYELDMPPIDMPPAIPDEEQPFDPSEVLF